LFELEKKIFLLAGRTWREATEGILVGSDRFLSAKDFWREAMKQRFTIKRNESPYSNPSANPTAT
jgi:CYTH domain-containing protein